MPVRSPAARKRSFVAIARADLPAPTRPAALLAAGDYLDKRGN